MKSNKKTIDSKKVGLGLAVAGAVAGAAVAGVAAYRRSKSEQVYHEAELKAMSELDDMNAENEAACEDCECADLCAGEECCETAEEQMEIAVEEAEEAEEAEGTEAADETEEASAEEVEAPADTEEEDVEEAEEADETDEAEESAEEE